MGAACWNVWDVTSYRLQSVMAKAFLDIDIGDADKHASEVAGCDFALLHPTPAAYSSSLGTQLCARGGTGVTKNPNPKP